METILEKWNRSQHKQQEFLSPTEQYYSLNKHLSVLREPDLLLGTGM